MPELNISYIDLKKKKPLFSNTLRYFYLFNFLVQGYLVLSNPVTAGITSYTLVRECGNILRQPEIANQIEIQENH